MDLIVKEAVEVRMTVSLPEKRYELFTVETVKDINDVDVEIPRLMGTYALADLQRQKEMVQNQLDEIDLKIDAISNTNKKN